MAAETTSTPAARSAVERRRRGLERELLGAGVPPLADRRLHVDDGEVGAGEDGRPAPARSAGSVGQPVGQPALEVGVAGEGQADGPTAVGSRRRRRRAVLVGGAAVVGAVTGAADRTCGGAVGGVAGVGPPPLDPPLAARTRAPRRTATVRTAVEPARLARVSAAVDLGPGTRSGPYGSAPCRLCMGRRPHAAPATTRGGLPVGVWRDPTVEGDTAEAAPPGAGLHEAISEKGSIP